MQSFEVVGDEPSRKIRFRLTTIALAFIITVIAFPNVANAIAAPVGSPVVGNESSTESEAGYAALESVGIFDKDVSFVLMDDMHVMMNGVNGYVNVLDDEDIIYLGSRRDPAAIGVNGWDSNVIHEYGHILQKRLVESRTSNPYERYSALLELNNILSTDAPAILEVEGHERTVAFSGIETNADCIVRVYHRFFKTSYIDGLGACDARAEATAELIVEGVYPDEGTVVARQAVVQNRKDKELAIIDATFDRWIELKTNGLWTPELEQEYIDFNNDFIAGKPPVAP